MDTFAISGLSFSYPEATKAALCDVSLAVREGEFLTLCGPSGCGKSTLLRQLKTVLAPAGERIGEILFEGEPLDTIDQRTQSARIGYVLQSPENQIVTDKVWHELAFGLESLGCDTPTIRRRVAEMASFFGIEAWFHKSVTELSGGQKQLLNLASIMAMQPSVLILDEPTSQLDPIAASDFIATIGKINRELGTTIILTEHRLEEAFPLSTRVVVMDKGGIICEGTPEQVGESLRTQEHTMFLAMPSAMRIWAAVPNTLPCPVTVRDGRTWLTEYTSSESSKGIADVPPQVIPQHGDTVVRLSDIWFKYEKDAVDVVKGLSLEAHRGELLAILGGNGVGKTTALKVIAELEKAYRGKVEVSGRVGTLPQNPQSLFVKKTVREDLLEAFKGRESSAAAREQNRSEVTKDAIVARAVKLCRLEELVDRHPYDLSGGEQQRAALAKVLIFDPEILLLDEPTKGLDAEYKQIFAQILGVLLRRGTAVIMVSHDVEFCAKYAHRCAMFFDGNVVAESTPREFFSGNSFYTTSANRIARSLIKDAVTPEDVIAACGGTVPTEADFPDDDTPLTPPRADAGAQQLKKLPFWRKLLAGVSGITALIAFIRIISVTDLTTLITSDGPVKAANTSFWLMGVFVLSMLVFALSIIQKSKTPVEVLQVSKDERKLSKRTIAATVMIVLLIPLTIFVGSYYFDDRKYYFISLLVILETMLPFVLVFESRKPQARELVTIASLCAIGVAGRAAFFMLPNFKPVMALVIISGVAFGGETGFLVGSMTMLVSNIFFGQGPFTPFQMFAMGIIGFLSGVLFRKGLLMRSRGAMCVFGALSAVIIYGVIMNTASALIWARTLNWKIVLTYMVPGFPFDLVHGAATVIFILLAAEPMLEKLDRIKVKYGLVS